MPARVEAEHIDDAALEPKPDLRLLVERRSVGQTVALVQDVICEGGRIGTEQKDYRRPVIETRLAHHTRERYRQRGFVVDRAHLDRLVPRTHLIVHEEARLVAKPRLH